MPVFSPDDLIGKRVEVDGFSKIIEHVSETGVRDLVVISLEDGKTITTRLSLPIPEEGKEPSLLEEMNLTREYLNQLSSIEWPIHLTCQVDGFVLELPNPNWDAHYGKTHHTTEWDLIKKLRAVRGE